MINLKKNLFFIAIALLASFIIFSPSHAKAAENIATIHSDDIAAEFKVNSALKDDKINVVRVVSDKDNANTTPPKIMAGGTSAVKYDIRHVKKAPDYIGKTVVRKLNGEPGFKLKLNFTKDVMATTSATFGATKKLISTSVGFTISKKYSVSYDGEYKVPSKVGKKKVKKVSIATYVVYATKKYDVYKLTKVTWWGKHEFKKQGTGKAHKPYGFEYRKTFTYKK